MSAAPSTVPSTAPRRPPLWLQALRSALFNAAMYLATAIICIAFLPLLLGPMRWAQLAGVLWSKTILFLLKLTCGLDHRVVGRERLPPGACIVAPKHHSTWETMAVYALIERRVTVLKRELVWIPLFGWYLLRSGSIAIDRKAGPKALRAMLRQARAMADRHAARIVIFPEGTRTAVGASAPYQPGIAALYGHLNLPVVPVALNSGVFWGRRTFVKWPGTITVEFLDPIPPGLKREQFMDLLRQRLETATARLVEQARAGR
ncbi:MAG: lysophospholipid acyltransferase family protein [Reyranellaceae bacterium]